MVFVVDDLAAWLVELLADASREKLATLVLGDPQERALRQAGAAAVQDVAGELSPSDSQRAGQIAMVMNEVFRGPVVDAPLAGMATLAEGLQAGISGQLAVLDDASMTGTGQSSAEVLGLPGSVLADRLTHHLMRQILLRGSRGGPLTPLADQLNHDLTRLQARRIEAHGQLVESMLAQIAGQVQEALACSGSGVMAVGWLLKDVTDPFALEVHRPVQPEDAPAGLPELPVYVRREHDEVLAQVAEAAARGRSGIAVLVGGSSTGKTRACWEALALLRGLDPEWRLWHPIDPSRPDAALAELPRIGPRTVVWLNEAQFYLDAGGGLGERVAAGLRELLRDPDRAPVLVLATLWPQFWDTLTSRPDGGADPHAQARELLVGHDIAVPAAFALAQLQRLGEAGDARLEQAGAGARDGQVIQFLAGAPELLARYRHARPEAAALIHAAMDARRLGMGPGLPRAFLEAAASGYLIGLEWDALGEDWLEQALAYTAVPCKGVQGPLTRIRPRPARSRPAEPATRNSPERPAGDPVMPLYRLADYLDQHGRRHRRGQFPPAAFWAAAARHASPGDQATLGDAAHARGLYCDAAQLHKNAAARGNPHSSSYLASDAHYFGADVRPVRWAADHVPLSAPYVVGLLLRRLRGAGAENQAALLRRNPAAHVPLDDPYAVADLLGDLQNAGAGEQVTVLAERAAAHISLDHPGAVARLLGSLLKAGAEDQIRVLLRRNPAAHVLLEDLHAVADLLNDMRDAGMGEQVTLLAERAAVHAPVNHANAVAWLVTSLFKARAVQQAIALAARAADATPLDDPAIVAALLDNLRSAGVEEQVTRLLRRDPAARVSLGNPYTVAVLLDFLRKAGLEDQAMVLLHRDPAAHARLDHPGAVARLVTSLFEAGDVQRAIVLAARATAHASLDDPESVAALLDCLRKVGAKEQADALAARAAAHIPMDNPGAVARLLDSLQSAGAEEQVSTLLRRDPAAHVSLDHPAAVNWLLGGVGLLLDSLQKVRAEPQVKALAARAAAHTPFNRPATIALLLDALRKAGAEEQVEVLLRRDPAAHVCLDDPTDVRPLLASLQAAGAKVQVTVLADRLPGAGKFELFRTLEGCKDRFRFGREADGSPARPWGWEDLD